MDSESAQEMLFTTSYSPQNNIYFDVELPIVNMTTKGRPWYIPTITKPQPVGTTKPFFACQYWGDKANNLFGKIFH